MEEGIQIDLEGSLIIGRNDTTFRGHNLERIHNWYSYVEGFSGNLVRYYLKKFNIGPNSNIMDPFSGCGTTVVESILFGTSVTGIDVNPFLGFVADVKSNLNVDTISLSNEIKNFKIFSEHPPLELDISQYISNIYLDKDYFSKPILKKIATIKLFIEFIKDDNVRDIFRLALASILVELSNMRRGPDLARRKDRREDIDAYGIILKKLLQMNSDLEFFENRRFGKANIIIGDSKDPELFHNEKYDLVITSPPYLNGTNYSRNTKLELWILDFLEKDTIRKLREKSVTAGINDTFAYKNVAAVSTEVNELVTKLEKVAYDQRIPMMVSAYFSDLNKVLLNLRKCLKEDGKCVLVTGDSYFSDVHIPTDLITMTLARQNNMVTIDSFKARYRKSRSGKPLRETIIIMEAV